MMSVLLVRVLQPLHLFWMDTRPEGLDQENRAAESEATEYLKAVAGRLESGGLDVQYRLLLGDPTPSLVEFARETPHDIIAMSSHGRTGVARWSLGSVAESLVRAIGDPVLIIPPHAHD